MAAQVHQRRRCTSRKARHPGPPPARPPPSGGRAADRGAWPAPVVRARWRGPGPGAPAAGSVSCRALPPVSCTTPSEPKTKSPRRESARGPRQAICLPASLRPTGERHALARVDSHAESRTPRRRNRPRPTTAAQAAPSRRPHRVRRTGPGGSPPRGIGTSDRHHHRRQSSRSTVNDPTNERRGARPRSVRASASHDHRHRPAARHRHLAHPGHGRTPEAGSHRAGSEQERRETQEGPLGRPRAAGAW
jgi:hypothetical protein